MTPRDALALIAGDLDLLAKIRNALTNVRRIHESAEGTFTRIYEHYRICEHAKKDHEKYMELM